jgi:hypothetical protein
MSTGARCQQLLPWLPSYFEINGDSFTADDIARDAEAAPSRKGAFYAANNLFTGGEVASAVG